MSMTRKKISFVSPCYNEEENVSRLYKTVCALMAKYPMYDFEYIFIDNASTDGTVNKLKEIAAYDKRLKIIVNTRNFGHIRSPYWGVMQSRGDATVYIASDFQDPPELIPKFFDAWEDGAKVVLAVKPSSKTNFLMHFIRRVYYRILDSISDVPLTKDATGFGLYDKVVIDQIRAIDDPYPYFRGLVDELGYATKTISFLQPRRERGVSKNKFYNFYDLAMIAIVSHSMVPIRVASISGFILGLGSIVAAGCILIAKLIWWDKFVAGLAPIVILLLFMFGTILLFIGLLGEYIGSVHTLVQKRPVVVESERINFEQQKIT
jgi:glycosyltransferase involved in cell wall biosynthesis